MVQLELSPKDFDLFRKYIYEKVGISLSDQKSTLVQGRLNKRISQLGFNSFREYYNHLVSDLSGDELSIFVSAISTNVTSFFREAAQWKWLESYLPNLVASKREKKLRIWSAGCSSGEEPYTILLFLQKNLPDFESWDIKILATDISSKVLSKAILGIYDAKQVEPLSKEMVLRSFEKIRMTEGYSYQVVQHLRDKITFRIFNLVTDPFIFTNKFDMIFCRNVMIYFDEPTRFELIKRFGTVLPKGAPLLFGSSESMTTHRETFKLVGSSIYQRL